MANPCPDGGSDASGAGIAPRRSATGTRSIVFGGVRKDGEFRSQIHSHVQLNIRVLEDHSQEIFITHLGWYSLLQRHPATICESIQIGGNEEQKTALEKSAAQEPAHKIEREK